MGRCLGSVLFYCKSAVGRRVTAGVGRTPAFEIPSIPRKRGEFTILSVPGIIGIVDGKDHIF